MAVPVMAVVSDVSERGSEGMIVSIKDTSSFGGSLIQPGDERHAAIALDDDLFVPGANLGIGYGASDEDEDETESTRPRYFSRYATIVRRGTGRSTGTDGGLGASGAASQETVAVTGDGTDPAVPATGDENLAYSAEHCIEPVDEVTEPEYTNYVVASGR